MYLSVWPVIMLMVINICPVSAAGACLTGDLAKFNALTTYPSAQAFCSKYYANAGSTVTITAAQQAPAKRRPATTTTQRSSTPTPANQNAALYSSIYSTPRLASTYCHCAEGTRTVTVTSRSTTTASTLNCAPTTEVVTITGTVTSGTATTTTVSYMTQVCEPAECFATTMTTTTRATAIAATTSD